MNDYKKIQFVLSARFSLSQCYKCRANNNYDVPLSHRLHTEPTQIVLQKYL